MSLMQEFKTFAVRGNVIDLAVGVIIGTAFGAIVSSLVGDVLMPLLGLFIGGVDFSEFAIELKPAQGEQPAVVLAYGRFIQACFNFLILALAVFFMVRAINNLRRREVQAPAAPATPPAPTPTEALLTEIRDLLRQRPAG